MTPEEKALLLQAVAEMAKANVEMGKYKVTEQKCVEAANLILESIKEDFEASKQPPKPFGTY
jgi:hypothetical protein